MNHTRHIVECRELGRELPSSPARFLAQNISFAVEPGEVLAIVGPSGSGKSTLLRMINRLDEPTHGAVYFHGEDYRGLSASTLRRSIGMVMQRAYLFPGTIAENIAFGPQQHGINITAEQIADLLRQVGLEGYAQRDPLTLSGGEAQRVAITRALANQPEVLLLDEPTSALDGVARSEVERLLESLIRERHLTCLWVTHSPEQARTMGDRVLRLDAGHMTAIGAADEVLGQTSEASRA
ncbi:MAG: phosphate ABC transporter ATP-binding protein [Silvibacterium sp.]